MPVLPPLTVGQRVMCGLLGAGSFGTGVLAVFVTDNGTGAAVLLIFGGVLLTLAMLGNQIESMEFGGARLRLRAAAAERYVLADEYERGGDLAEADRLRVEAAALIGAAGPIAAEYRMVRGSMGAGPDRTRAMEEVVNRARALAKERPFEAAEVARWLRWGTEEERITALGMMQARPELRDFEATIGAIGRPRSNFEQYQAMRLAIEMIDELDPVRRHRLAATVRAARRPRLRRDVALARLRQELLDRLG